MKKKLKQYLTLLLALVLVMTGVDLSSLKAEASEATTRYYTFNDLTDGSALNGTWGVSKNVSAAGALSISFSGQYAEAQYALPAGVDASTITNVTLHLTGGANNSLAVKLYADGAQAAVKYESNVLDVATALPATTDVVIGIMNNTADALSGVVIDYISITAVQTGGLETPPAASGNEGSLPVTRYYTFSELAEASVVNGTWGVTKSVSAAGALSIGFSGQYAEAQYALPAGVDASTLMNITLYLSSGANNSLAVKVYADNAEAQAAYESNAINVTADLSAATSLVLGIMNNTADALEGVVIDYISITAVQTGGSETVPSGGNGGNEGGNEGGSTGAATTKYYTFNDVTLNSGYGYEQTVSSAGALSLSFTESQYGYQPIAFSLPAGVETNTITNITFHFAQGEPSQLAIKLYAEEINTGNWSNQVATSWAGTGSIDVTADQAANGLKYFAIVHNNADGAALSGLVIDYFTITAVQTGGSETVPPAGDNDGGGDDGGNGGNDEGGNGGNDTVILPTRYYTFNDVTADASFGNTAIISAEGALSLSFTENYAQAAFTFPAGVTATTLDKLSLLVSSGDESGLAIKIFTAAIDDTFSNAAQTAYNKSEIEVEDAVAAAGPLTFVIMNVSGGAADYVIDGFGIVAEQTGGSETKPGGGGNDGGNDGGNGGGTGDVTGNITPAGDISYQAGQLTKDWGNATDEQIAENKWQVTFGSQYKEIRWQLPETVDLNRCKSVTFAVSSQTAPLGFKLYDADCKEITDFTKYSQKGKTLYTYELYRTETVGYIGIILNENKTNVSCVFDGIMFDMMGDDEVLETYELPYTAAQLVLDGITGGATSTLVGNVHSITFAALNDEVCYQLPEIINLTDCISFTVKVANQTGPVNFYLGKDGTKVETFYYNVGKDEYTIYTTKDTKINELYIQCGGESYTANSAVDILGITFLMEGKKPLPTPTDGLYSFGHFETVAQTAGVSIAVNDADNSADIIFPHTGDVLTMAIPDSVDLSHLVSIAFNGVDVTGLEIQLLDKNMQPIMYATGNTFNTKCNPDIAYIHFISKVDNKYVKLTGVQFNIDPNAYESIILNGNFAREDVSMWSSAVWGSVDGVETTITTGVSDTPIYDDVYTYGIIGRRSSPYVCFAQDVTDRVEPGKTYEIRFFAKLSEDYEGWHPDVCKIQYSPYYVDENGKEQYGLNPVGSGYQVASTDEWQLFVAKVQVPSNAQKFVVRIIEQGTEYGKGDCIMGSYYITGVYMTECDPVYVSYGGGSSANTTITKEATCVLEYDMDDLLVDWASATATKKANNGLNITFKNNYDEVRLKLPRMLDMSTAAYIKVNTETQNVPIAVKLYYKGSQVDVGYYNSVSTEYTLVPEYTGMVDAIGIMSLAKPNPSDAYADFAKVTFGLTAEPAPLPEYDTIVVNGDFASDDLSDWMASYWGQGDGVTITHETASTPIGGEFTNYATYSHRTSPYQCFAQDITGRVEENETYTFSFWAKLSDEYKGAPDAQRIIQFAPYTVDSDGNADYNPRLSGTSLQTLEPGVWTYFEGTYKVTNANDVAKVVIRIVEQGTDYGQGDCVLGGFSVTGVKMEKYIPEPPSIDEDVPDLRDSLAEVFGEDFITGTAVTINEAEDIGVEMLVNKHFNAVTLGNELKPDALFGYSNSEHTELQTITFNGESLVVPTLDFSRAEEVLNQILEWNEKYPDNQLKVRGHVLVWHSQTPEWFFREDYVVGNNADCTPNYVSPEEMSLRLEWFIKTVLEHFLGEDSPYKDLFYGWDVVNEAVSNGSASYRTNTASSVEEPNADTHSVNSSWWAIYQSNEFIIKAFQYANKYAPAEVELYYNDYNECDYSKSKGIVQLLTDVLAAEGTRIDAMGMQAHYNMYNPSVYDIEKAIRAYAEVVGKVQLTELDMKVSGDISSEEALQAEYLKQAERYHDIFKMLKKLDAEEGIEIGGITFWGTVDHYSWLQSSSSVGGGADGTMTQCPLLFDINYKVKPSYWAFVDYTMVDPDYVEEAEDSTATGDTATEPEGEATSEAEGANDSTADTTTPESSDLTENTPVPEKEKSGSVAPFIAIGGVVLAAIAAVVAVLIRKKKATAEPKNNE